MKRIILIVTAAVMVLAAPLLHIISFPYFELMLVVRVAGLLGFGFMTLQFLLASRFPFLDRIVGQDVLIHWHRVSGMASVLFLLIHGVLYSIQRILWEGSLSLSLPEELPILNGMVGLLLLVFLGVGAALRPALGMPYDQWKRFHRLAYVLYPALFLHSLALGTTILSLPVVYWLWMMMFGLVVLSWVWRVSLHIRSRRTPYLVSRIEKLTHDVVRLSLAGPPLEYRPGQFVFLALRDGKKVYPSHPFTLASTPTDKDLGFCIKGVGDFTSALQDLEAGREAYVEGPYGRFSHTLAKDNGDLLFIAGGVGITPFLSMLGLLKTDDPDRNVVLIWGNKTPADRFMMQQLDDALKEMRNLRIVHVFSDSMNGLTEDTETRSGFVDQSLLHKELTELSRAEIYICGPPVMMKKVKSILHDEGVKDRNIHMERFAL